MVAGGRKEALVVPLRNSTGKDPLELAPASFSRRQTYYVHQHATHTALFAILTCSYPTQPYR